MELVPVVGDHDDAARILTRMSGPCQWPPSASSRSVITTTHRLTGTLVDCKLIQRASTGNQEES
jgi:hypothetical protein